MYLQMMMLTHGALEERMGTKKYTLPQHLLAHKSLIVTAVKLYNINVGR